MRQLLALEKLIPDSKQVALERTELLRQREGTPPPPIETQPDVVEPAGLSEEEARKGCARWLPFISRWTQ